MKKRKKYYIIKLIIITAVQILSERGFLDGKQGIKSMEKKQDMSVRTMVFDIPHDKEESMKAMLRDVYNAMSEKGYNPINQIVGYILSEDPTYITNHKGARSLIRKIDRDELLNELVKDYLGV